MYWSKDQSQKLEESAALFRITLMYKVELLQNEMVLRGAGIFLKLTTYQGSNCTQSRPIRALEKVVSVSKLQTKKLSTYSEQLRNIVFDKKPV